MPQVLPWDERCKGVQPMPGGGKEFLASLRDVVMHVEEQRPTVDELERWWVEQCNLTSFSSRSRLNFLIRTRLLMSSAHGCEVGPSTRVWLDSGDSTFVVAQLHAGARFIGELLDAIRVPKAQLELLDLANDKYAFGWQTKNQVLFRINWLQSAEAVSVGDDRRWALTQHGSSILEALEIHVPHEPAQHGDTGKAATEDVAATAAASQQVDRLTIELVEASTDANNPSRFERAVHQCLQFLGYESELMGQSGRTDVLLTAPLGRGASYRVAVDAKTTAKGSLHDQPIDWATLTEHRERVHRTDYSLIVGPNPTGQRLEQRAIDHSVVVMSAEELASLCRQHSRLALGLHTYRTLFESPGFLNTSAVDEEADGALRLGRIAALVQSRVATLCEVHGAVSARDIQMSLAHSNLGDLEDTLVTEDDICAALEFLSNPLVRSLHVASSASDDSGGDSGQPMRYMPSANPVVSRLQLTQVSDFLDPQPQGKNDAHGAG
ncbi:hypothetical protein [Candidatus Poriferisodalis sp.]|uniref:hypothetical protein n=1 Tax=Candidatus Poriferisodalis sp. TaxID=3101277 RepID=UPI003B5B7DC5